MIEKINIKEKFGLFSDHWHPRIIGQVNDAHIKIARLKGEFESHHHDLEDEMFLVLEGSISIELKDGTINLSAGEMAVIPRGTEHKPVAREEALVMFVEPASTLNTGNLKNERTTEAHWI